MKVWILWESLDWEVRILGIYSTHEGAKKAKAALIRYDQSRAKKLTIEEWEVSSG